MGGGNGMRPLEFRDLIGGCRDDDLTRDDIANRRRLDKPIDTHRIDRTIADDTAENRVDDMADHGIADRLADDANNEQRITNDTTKAQKVDHRITKAVAPAVCRSHPFTPISPNDDYPYRHRYHLCSRSRPAQR